MSTNPGQDRQSAQAISNAITRLQRDHFGRGPSSVRTVVGFDHVITFLESTVMAAEQTLIEAGELEAVEESRRAFQRAMKSRYVHAVEEITGRTVRAFLSQGSIEPDIQVEVFVLEHLEHAAPEGVA